MLRPNILFLMTDQQRWDALGCSGGWVNTPNLDQIAKEGVRFANCVTTSPVCIPTRLSLATGLYPHNTGIWNNMNHTMPVDTPTWMQVIRSVGYRTSLFGKTHLHPHHGDLRDREGLMNSYGLDDVNEIGGPRASARVLSHMTADWQQKGVWKEYQADYAERFSNCPHVVRPSVVGLDNYADVYVGQQAKKYLADYQYQQPWFCWVSFGGPHEPWDTPEPYASMYKPEDMPPAIQPPKMDNLSLPTNELQKKIQRNTPISAEEAQRLRADYAGNIKLIDDQIGQILETIRLRGELENTVIVFVSDHGEMNGDFGLIYKSNFLNGAVRVPLIVRTPKTVGQKTSQRVSHSPVEWIDIGPTLVELAGGSINYHQHGKSLMTSLSNPDVEHRSTAISELDGEIMLLDQEWKIVLNKNGEPYLLFDVQKDPNEINNLVVNREHRNIVIHLRLKILERLMSTRTKR